MNIKISNFTPNGKVDIPTSKSIAHRYLIMGFLANEEVKINDISFSNDVNATLNCLIALGANVEKGTDYVIFHKPNNIIEEDVVLDAKESGSTLRFLIPLAGYLCKSFTFKGKESLFSRPLSIYEDIFNKQNIEYEKGKDYLKVKGQIKSEDVEIRGDISSQFITGLIYLSIASGNKNTIKITPPYESKEYVLITLKVAEEFGYKFIKHDFDYRLDGYENSSTKEFFVEKDFSQVAFFALLGCLNGVITLDGLDMNSLQGDKKMISILKEAGANIKQVDKSLTFNQSKLKGLEIDIASCIDLGPILFVFGATSEGVTHIKNIRRLRIKESDRVKAMVDELKKVGVKFKESENDIYIEGKNHYQGDYEFSTHNDHRICMALSVFASINKGTCTLLNAECVNKSYVKFFDDLKSVGGIVNVG